MRKYSLAEVLSYDIVVLFVIKPVHVWSTCIANSRPPEGVSTWWPCIYMIYEFLITNTCILKFEHGFFKRRDILHFQEKSYSLYLKYWALKKGLVKKKYQTKVFLISWEKSTANSTWIMKTLPFLFTIFLCYVIHDFGA